MVGGGQWWSNKIMGYFLIVILGFEKAEINIRIWSCELWKVPIINTSTILQSV